MPARGGTKVTTEEEALAPILACGPQVVRSQKAFLRQWDDLPLSAAIDARVKVFAK